MIFIMKHSIFHCKEVRGPRSRHPLADNLRVVAIEGAKI